MADIPDVINEIINTFIHKLNESNISLSKAVLFGSYSNGGYNEDSDIDIAIVSPDFSGDLIDDNRLIRSSKFAAGYEIEAHTFTEEEFSEDNPFVREILKNGIVIYPVAI